MGHRVEETILIPDAHSTWSPKDWDLGASRSSMTYVNTEIFLIMACVHSSLSQGALEEAAIVEKWKTQMEWENEARH